MEKRKFRYIFGPVPSRRLGRSLGIDVVPLKTCSYNCIYCQLGRTTNLTVERREWVSAAEVLREMADFAAEGVPIDYATFSGSGEPTLHSGLGRLIAGAKERLGAPVAVLTNGSFLSDPAVRRDLAEADLVCPSLDAPDPETFQRINRPHPSIDFHRMAEGLITFTREFSGEVWLEIFLVEGVNTAPEQIEAFRGLAGRIGPDRVQLNTAVRPTAEAGVLAVSRSRLEEIRRHFGPSAEIIPSLEHLPEGARSEIDEARILETLARRPQTAWELASVLDVKLAEVQKSLEMLCAEGRLSVTRRDGKVFYAVE